LLLGGDGVTPSIWNRSSVLPVGAACTCTRRSMRIAARTRVRNDAPVVIIAVQGVGREGTGMCSVSGEGRV